MEALLKFLDTLVTSGGVSGVWLAACLGIGGLGVLFFYIVKSIMLLSTYFKTPDSNVSKQDIQTVKNALQDDNKYVLKLLEGVLDRLKAIEQGNDQVVEINRQLENEIIKVNALVDRINDMQDEDLKASNSIKENLSSFVIDSKAQHFEVTRQVQVLQVDLASLTGTIIGLNSQRSRLK
jgi:hypothetical protein